MFHKSCVRLFKVDCEMVIVLIQDNVLCIKRMSNTTPISFCFVAAGRKEFIDLSPLVQGRPSIFLYLL